MCVCVCECVCEVFVVACLDCDQCSSYRMVFGIVLYMRCVHVYSVLLCVFCFDCSYCVVVVYVCGCMGLYVCVVCIGIGGYLSLW